MHHCQALFGVERRMNAATRWSNLPKSMAGQTYCYDKDTVGMPVEIHPSPSIWQDVPEIHRHDGTPGPTGVKGEYIYPHNRLLKLLGGKKEKA